MGLVRSKTGDRYQIHPIPHPEICLRAASHALSQGWTGDCFGQRSNGPFDWSPVDEENSFCVYLKLKAPVESTSYKSLRSTDFEAL